MEQVTRVKSILSETGYCAIDDDRVCKVVEMGEEKVKLVIMAISETEGIAVATETAYYENVLIHGDRGDLRSISAVEFAEFRVKLANAIDEYLQKGKPAL